MKQVGRASDGAPPRGALDEVELGVRLQLLRENDVERHRERAVARHPDLGEGRGAAALAPSRQLVDPGEVEPSLSIAAHLVLLEEELPPLPRGADPGPAELGGGYRHCTLPRGQRLEDQKHSRPLGQASPGELEPVGGASTRPIVHLDDDGIRRRHRANGRVLDVEVLERDLLAVEHEAVGVRDSTALERVLGAAREDEKA